ncbi:MAG: beta-galactosidase [Syntrophaceae bacterium]|nr:beta-galactosidase [Syntrophaceae bacterium]
MENEFITGVNYWPIESAINWWHGFDASVVEDDFSRIQEAGLKVVRIFLLWEDFQPLPKKVSTKALDELVHVLEIAHRKSLLILPTLFTGHMSGVNYLPLWMLELKESDDRFPVFSEGKRRRNRIRNFYSDREVMEAQKYLVREVSSALHGHPSLWAWDLGNEPSNLAIPNTKEEALIWLEEMVSEVKKRNEAVSVTLGLHQEDLEEDRKMGPKEVGAFCDFLSMHTYPIYARWADSPLDEEVSPFLGLLTQWLGSKEVLIEEVGVPCSREPEEEGVYSEEKAYGYYERLLTKLRNFPFLGALFWCYGDYAKSLWGQAPFDKNRHERYFGLFREDRSPKPHVSLLKNVQRRKGTGAPCLDWIDIEPEEYFQEAQRSISRLYRRFKERGL